MALTFNQAAIAGTLAVSLFTVPPGQFELTFLTTASTNLFLGTSNSVSAANGFAVLTSPVSIHGFTGSKGATIWGLNTAASTLNVSYVLTTNH